MFFKLQNSIISITLSRMKHQPLICVKLILCFPGSGKCYFFTNFQHRHCKVFTFFTAVWKRRTESQACWKTMGGLTSAWFNKLSFLRLAKDQCMWDGNGCADGKPKNFLALYDFCSVLSCLILSYSDSSCSAWVRKLHIYPSCFLNISDKKTFSIFFVNFCFIKV